MPLRGVKQKVGAESGDTAKTTRWMHACPDHHTPQWIIRNKDNKHRPSNRYTRRGYAGHPMSIRLYSTRGRHRYASSMAREPHMNTYEITPGVSTHDPTRTDRHSQSPRRHLRSPSDLHTRTDQTRKSEPHNTPRGAEPWAARRRSRCGVCMHGHMQMEVTPPPVPRVSPRERDTCKRSPRRHLEVSLRHPSLE